MPQGGGVYILNLANDGVMDGSHDVVFKPVGMIGSAPPAVCGYIGIPPDVTATSDGMPAPGFAFFPVTRP